MAIPENQLDTWSSLGSVQQSASTYASIKRVLEDSGAPYVSKNFETFLQGSYGNDTNIYADSDVDIVMNLTSTFYKDISQLSPSDKAAYEGAFSDASYSWNDFKGDVTQWLTRNFNGVTSGNKAAYIPANGSRRNADVVVAVQFRYYYEFKSTSNQRYTEGICFWSKGQRIENYPKVHSTRCTQKHQNTNSRFKPTVRIFKNMRNRLIEKNKLTDGAAPSYFIENMLWNVPNDKFKQTHADTFVECMGWLSAADETQFTTASGMHWLVRNDTPTSWPATNYATFLTALWDQWEGWRTARFI